MLAWVLNLDFAGSGVAAADESADRRLFLEIRTLQRMRVFLPWAFLIGVING